MAIRVTDLRTAQGDYKALDDRMLVLDFQAGHPEAFVEIHRRYSGLARHVCQRFLPNAHDADEALQETMIRVFQGLHRFNGRYALKPWIGRIATNVSLDAIRTRTRRPLVDDESLERFERVDPADGPEEAVERLIERDLVLSVLSGLPESHRTALVLRELEGRSHREIGEFMEMSPGQAKALIHRAKGSFRRRWLLAVTEKGGLSAIAALPLLWLLRATHLAKRVVDRVSHAGQVSQVATPEIVSTAASSPAVVATGAGFGERTVAAGMTLLVAGGVTVGAATIVKDRGERADRAEAPVVAPEIVDAPPLDPKADVLSPPVRERVHGDRAYDGATAAVNVNLQTGVGGGQGTDTLTGVENARGTAFDDTLVGSASNNVLSGGAGNDTMSGADGNDTLRGGSGDDTTRGGAGSDTVRGGSGNDSARGGGGDDSFRGGSGNDGLRGGGGNDNNRGGAGNDTIAGGPGNDVCRGGPGSDSIRSCEN